jgi:hypothetical protein
MDVKQKMWSCRSSLFAAKRFLGARQHKGRLKLTDVGMFCWKMPRITNEIKLSDLLIETQPFFE